MGNTICFESLARKPKRPILSLPNRPSAIRQCPRYKAANAPRTIHTRYPHPQTGDKHFGFVPSITSLPHHLRMAPIVLTHGWQTENESGMGVVHIWRGHEAELRALDYGSEEDVPDFVARVVKPGAKIVHLPNERGQVRLGVHNHLIGLVVLGPKRCGWAWEWRVITAYDPIWFCCGKAVGCVQAAPHLN